MCLVCGHLGCGRYARGHAKDHAHDHRHRFCLDLASGRIWDYNSDVFVHRKLVQMAAASGGLFEVTLPAPAVDEASPAPPRDGPKQVAGMCEVLSLSLRFNWRSITSQAQTQAMSNAHENTSVTDVNTRELAHTNTLRSHL